jgi:(p)ppGpp synthase/HD superfamily hydrolase
MATLEEAISIAAKVHAGQKDKAGDPYILHPLRMMMRMSDETTRIVAVLHDVVEDSSEEDKWDAQRLRSAGFTEEVIEALDCVTDRKDQGETYEEFVERAASNPVSRQVKIADLEDNMNMLRLGAVGEKQLERLARYHRSWKRLTSICESGEMVNYLPRTSSFKSSEDKFKI